MGFSSFIPQLFFLLLLASSLYRRFIFIEWEYNKWCGAFLRVSHPEACNIWLIVLHCSVSKLCPTLQSHRLKHTRLLCPWSFLGKNTGTGCRFLLQEIFLTQGWNLHLLGLLHWQFSLAQFSCSVVSNCLQPMDCSMPGFPVHHQLLELAQAHVHQVSDAIQTSHPLSSPSPPAFNLSQHQDLFQWVSSLH